MSLGVGSVGNEQYRRRERFVLAVLVVVCIIENLRQHNFSSWIMASTGDAVCGLMIMLHLRCLSWVFWASVALALLMGAAHLVAFGIPPLELMFAVKSLPLMVASLEIISANESGTISRRWSFWTQRALVVAMVLFALYAVMQSLTGFRYSEGSENTYNTHMLHEGAGGLRLPSIFYFYGNYAEFSLAAAITLWRGMRIGTITGLWATIGLAGAIAGTMLTGQRSAFIAICTIVTVAEFKSGRLLRIVGATAGLLLAFFVLRKVGLAGYVQRASDAFSFDRFWEQAGISFVDWFVTTPLEGWGFGSAGGGGPERLARLGAARNAFRFTALQYAYKPTTVLEGNIPYLLMGGGVVWLAFHVMAAVFVLRRAGTMARQVFLGMALWGLNHNVISTAYAFVFSILLSGVMIGRPVRAEKTSDEELSDGTNDEKSVDVATKGLNDGVGERVPC